MSRLRVHLEAILASSRRYGYICQSDLKEGYIAQNPSQTPGEGPKNVIKATKKVGKGSLGGLLGEKLKPNVFPNKIKNCSKILIGVRPQKIKKLIKIFQNLKFSKSLFSKVCTLRVPFLHTGL